MLVFIAIFYSLTLVADHADKKDTAHIAQQAAERSETIQEFKSKERRLKEKFSEAPAVSAGFSFAFLALLVGGVIADIILIQKRSRNQPIVSMRTHLPEPRWGGRAVFQAFVFLFFVEILLYIFYVLSLAMDWMHMPKDYYLLVHSLLRNFAVALFVLLLVRLKFGQGLRELGFTSQKFFARIREALWGYLAVIPPLIFIFAWLSLILKFFTYEPEPQNVVQIFLKESTESYLVAFTLFVALLGPILEEMFFRGFAFGALKKKWGIWPAAILSSAIFAAFHFNAVAFLPILFLGLFLTYLYESTGSLVTPIAAHMLHNTVMVAITLMFKNMTS